jgi:diaminopimelate epimerase
MKTTTYYHGTKNSDVIINALLGNGKIDRAFHMTPDLTVAKNYGAEIVEITFEDDLKNAHIGIINKDGNFNKSVGNGVEIVVKTPAAINELYFKLVDAKVM